MLLALLGGALLLVGFAGRGAPTSGAAPTRAGVLYAGVSATPLGRPIPSGFVGLSMELPALSAYAGTDPSALNPLFIALVRQLSPGARPWLRIGGRSADAAWLPAAGLQTRSPALRFQVTGAWLRVAHAVAAALDAETILDVNMAAGYPALARAEATAMRAVVGPRYIAAFEIGNEPDVYGFLPWYPAPGGAALLARPQAYAMRDYLAQFSTFRRTLGAGPVAGPAFAGFSWMSQLAAFLASEPGLALVTFHQYPLWACQRNPNAANFPSIVNVLRPSSSDGLAAQIAPFAALAHHTGLRFRLDELNSAACTGRRGVSDTFAAALWSLDTLFALAAAGVDGVNIHTLPGAAYAPFSFEHRGGRWSATVQPLYYGLLAFTRAFPAGARLLRVSAPAGPVKVWATTAPDGHVRVVLINEQASAAATFHLRLAGAATPLSEQALRAPSLQSSAGVTLGGESFAANTSSGELPASSASIAKLTASASGFYDIHVPPASALLLTR